MYAHSSNTASPLLSPSELFPDLTEFETFSQLNNSETSYCYNNNNNNNSNCSSYGGSPSSVASPNNIMQNNNNGNGNGTHNPLSALIAELFHSDDSSVRRVCSASDLQGVNGMQHNHHTDSPLSSESSMIIEGMSRACRYSPEEKKVRIERYRNKRNQRNFNKKIKYACRKTLADSRPRIRGRFARNGEIDKNSTVQWSQIGAAEEEDEEEENWVTILDSLVAANFAQESQGSSSFGLLC